MRNFSKTLISMAAVMAVGSAMAAGAMAGELTVSTKDAEGKDTLANGTVTISDVTPGMSQYTLLVVEGVEVTVDDKKEIKYDANEDTIVQIDQNDDGTPFSTIVVGTDLTKGATYQVRVGNNKGEVDEGYFTVGGGVEYRDYIIGDINDDKRVLTNDATYLKKKLAKKTEGIGLAGTEFVRDTGKKLIVGDINDDGRVLTNDATYLKKKLAKKTEGIGLAGTTVQVVK